MYHQQPPHQNQQPLAQQPLAGQVQPAQYSLPVIAGRAPRLYMPTGTSLVLEGGGTRGFYSAGVMDAFMDMGIMFPYIAAVSAGAANALSYISGQRGRNRLVVEHLVKDPRYISINNLMKDRSLFNYDFIFNTVPREYLYFDQRQFDHTQTRFLTGALDCWEGKTIWYEKNSLGTHFMPVIASCSVPLISPMVRFDSRSLLDGGILAPIPIEKAIADKNRFHVIVLTQGPGYRKSPMRLSPLMHMFYRKYPHLVWAMQERHNAYNRQLAIAQQLVREGRALIIQPQDTIKVSRFENDPQKLLALYDEGHRDGAGAVVRLRQLLGF